MNKWFKYSLISLLVLVMLFFSVAIYVYQNLDQFKAYALKEINKQLKSEISTGRIDLNLFADFPRVSITFHQVKLTDPLRSDSLLLNAKTLYLGFDFYDVLQEKYVLHSLYADSAKVNLFINKDGVGNYDIVKENKESSNSNSTFKFELNLLKLKNSIVQYEQESPKQFYSLYFNETSLSGNFNEKEFELQAKANALIHVITLSGLDLMKQKPLDFDLKFFAKPGEGLYTIQLANVKLSKLNLKLNGKVQLKRTFTDYDLNFKGDKIKIQELISLLPIQLPASVNEMNSEGLVYFNGSYSGKESKQSKPILKVDFGVEDGVLSNKRSGIELTHIKFKGGFLSGNSNQQLGSLSINDLSATFGEELINGALSIDLSDQSKLKAQLKGGFDLNRFQNMFQLPSIKTIQGNAKFEVDLNVQQEKGEWNWINPQNKIHLDIAGNEMVLTDFSKPVQNYHAELDLKDENIQIKQLDIHIGKTDLSGSGNLPGIFSKEPSSTLFIELKSHSNYLDAEDLMIYEPKSSSEEGTASKVFRILLQSKANDFKYQNLIAKNLQANLEIQPGLVRIVDLKMNAWGGQVQTTGTFDFSGKQYVLNAEPKLSGVKVKQLLKEFDDFAQDAIKSEHIDGTLNSNSKVLMVWDEKFNFIKPKFKAVAELNMKNGQLINYEPLFALSKFIDLNDLKNLKFSELKNTLEIANEKLIIPEMDIKTNAISLSVSGIHSFENFLDYHLKITLNELLNKKRKVKENEFGEEDETPGKVNLFLSIKGPANNLKFTYDKKAVRAKIAEDLKKEGATIKEIIKSEIGFKKDTTIKQSNRKDGNNDELEFEPE